MTKILRKIALGLAIAGSLTGCGTGAGLRYDPIPMGNNQYAIHYINSSIAAIASPHKTDLDLVMEVVHDYQLECPELSIVSLDRLSEWAIRAVIQCDPPAPDLAGTN